MENLAVLTAFYHSGSFRNHLLGFGKKKCYLPAKVGPYWEKLCPRSSGGIQDLGHSFSQYGPPVR